MEINQIIQGDCLEKLKELEPNSVDTIITDPPYDLSTVNRYANSKPAKSNRNGGNDGFQGVNKGFMGKEWDGTGIAFKQETWEECLRVTKPGGTLLTFGGTRTYHRMACAIEDAGWILKDCIMWLYGSGFPKATDISKQLDKGHKRKVVGKSKDSANRKKGGTFIGENEGERNITAPATPQAKQWNGWKSHGLKPAYEPIIVAMKPNEGSYANNALKYGVSGLNIEEARIPIDIDKEKDNRVGTDRVRGDKKGLDSTSIFGQSKEGVQMYKDGRFPANIILDEEAGKMLDEQSGESKTLPRPIADGKKLDKDGNWGFKRMPHNISDKGGASRFFYCAKASKSERNAGCEELEEKQAGMCMKDDKFTRENMGNTPASEREPIKNNHPTVKPLKLMEYLCTLTKTPTGGIVLDPFAGSGTTGLACQNTDRDFILIEKEEEYIKIIKARLNRKRQIKLI